MIPQDAIKTIIQQQGWKRLLLAVSGGLDSICLAHFFVAHKADLGIEWLGIAHVHHGLREETADRDAEFVQNFAIKNNVPFFLEKLDGDLLKAKCGSLEEIAREARYKALRKFATDNLADAILTAHHGNDQAETLYYRIRRGVSLAGLRGIHPIRKFESVNLFRPFLQVTRKDLLEYAKSQNLDWREDESNSDESYARNAIRHTHLPHLEETVPGAVQQLNHIAELAQHAYPKVLQAAEKSFSEALVPHCQWPFQKEFSPYQEVLALNLEKLPFRTLPEALQDEVFRLWLDNRGFRLPVGERLLSNAGENFIRLKGIFIEKCRDTLWICNLHSASGQNNLYLVDEQNFSEKAEGLRFRKEGDILWPKDEKISPRKLEQWLRGKGIPRWMFDSLPLRASENRILFVHGLRLQES